MNQLFSQRHLITCGVCLQLLWLTGQAQEVRQHAAHEHGSASLNIVMTDHQIHVEFQSPAINIVGFEHQPRSEQQAGQVAAAMNTLKQENLLLLPAAAGCSLREAHAETGLMPITGDHEVVRDDEHRDGHASGAHGEHSTESSEAEADAHSEFTATQLYECEDPGKLRFIDVVVFDLFPGNREIHAQIVEPTRQTLKTLTPDSRRIELEN